MFDSSRQSWDYCSIGGQRLINHASLLQRQHIRVDVLLYSAAVSATRLDLLRLQESAVHGIEWYRCPFPSGWVFRNDGATPTSSFFAWRVSYFDGGCLSFSPMLEALLLLITCKQRSLLRPGGGSWRSGCFPRSLWRVGGWWEAPLARHQVRAHGTWGIFGGIIWIITDHCES